MPHDPSKRFANRPPDQQGNDQDAPLRDDVRLLGELLGETLRTQAGDSLYKSVEQVRSLSKAARNGNKAKARTLTKKLNALDAGQILLIARAFTHFLNFANIAEQHHQFRLQRNSRLESDTFNAIEEEMIRLLNAGISKKKIVAAVHKLNVNPVFTAHPTEVTRRTLTQKFQRIAALLAKRDRTDLIAEERELIIEELKRIVIAIWETDEIRRDRPTPLDEARAGLVVAENTLWVLLPQYLRRLDKALYKYTGSRLEIDASPVRFGSWMGGDRDGNPNVTPDITRQVLLMARWQAADLYWHEVNELRRELSMKDCNRELRKLVGKAREPYRVLLAQIRDRLLATRRHMETRLAGDIPASKNIFFHSDELAQPLKLCYQSLIDCDDGAIANGRLLDLIRRLNCFGLTLMQLDIRQEAARHTQVLDEITRYLSLGCYQEWDEAQRQKFLIDELSNKRPLIPANINLSKDAREVLDTFRLLATESPESLGAYIISMASQPSDVLAVELLQRECGVEQRLRVVPLFERVDDLKGAAVAIDRLLGIPWYKNRINGHQEIMIGYSDSAKDAGQIAAAWGLYQAQEQLAKLAKQQGIRLTLFHGRGGTVARGGGPARAAIRSLPPGSVDASMRITEQGEVIQAKYGTPQLAGHTLDIYTTAILEATLTPPPEPKTSWRNMMHELSRESLQTYRGVVQKDPKFIDYFRAATPEAELGKLNIGSRPARRKPGRSIKFLRAIPWIFAWTQTRLMLPAWLGVGEALEQAIDQNHLKLLRTMQRRWPFFAATLDVIEMVLAKTDPTVAARYDERLVARDLQKFGKNLRSRFDLTARTVLSITGHNTPLEHHPVTQRSISVRNPYTDPLNLMQIELLARVRNGEKGEIQDALLVAINGISAGMRNTG